MYIVQVRQVIFLIVLLTQEEDKDCDGFAFKHLRDFHHGRRVVAIAWSPETSIDVLPRCLRYSNPLFVPFMI